MRRVVILVILVWLVSGVVAVTQRDDLKGAAADCDHISTVAATALAGPFNYTGAHPEVTC
ncbi:hypothetical protein Cs7R123_08290 [Catellatospora sp. TT07R-123]|uniref:hypothetical protein n=1 Tax=Catellatospora sp. TT07R-123 TaxID=2733863 RepID=UPI001B16DA86|nr:hypothetical protein [Catellatospora sp. TT07R-123]GHJ43487.1 hypothetical protein Cs7R123_08290 [Catellatospora sp. TT07R-123]